MLCNGYKTTFMEKCIKFTINIRENYTNFLFPPFNRHFVDQVSADYNGYYIQESGKSDKYGFFGCLPE